PSQDELDRRREALRSTATDGQSHWRGHTGLRRRRADADRRGDVADRHAVWVLRVGPVADADWWAGAAVRHGGDLAGRADGRRQCDPGADRTGEPRGAMGLVSARSVRAGAARQFQRDTAADRDRRGVYPAADADRPRHLAVLLEPAQAVLAARADLVGRGAGLPGGAGRGLPFRAAEPARSGDGRA